MDWFSSKGQIIQIILQVGGFVGWPTMLAFVVGVVQKLRRGSLDWWVLGVLFFLSTIFLYYENAKENSSQMVAALTQPTRLCEKLVQEMKGRFAKVYEDREVMASLGKCQEDPTIVEASEQFFDNGVLLWRPGYIYMIVLEGPFMFHGKWYRDRRFQEAVERKERIGKYDVERGFLAAYHEYSLDGTLGLPETPLQGLRTYIQKFDRGLVIGRVSKGIGAQCVQNQCMTYALVEVGKQAELTGSYLIHNYADDEQ